MDRLLVALILMQSIWVCYQQDTNVCPIGTDYFNGACIRSLCPETHYLVNGACLLRPTGTASCGFGFDLINGMCVQQNCPPNFVMINGLCQQQFNNPPSLFCPNGFSIHNEMCFPNPNIIPPPFCQPKPCRTFNCPFNCDGGITHTTPATTTTTTTTSTSTPTTTPTTTTTTTTTTPKPPTKSPDKCPPEYVIVDGECRFVFCIKGQFYKGHCLEPVCSGGLVWTGRKCTQPEVITTVLEIENKFITETNQTGPDFHASKSKDNIVYVNETNHQTGPNSQTKISIGNENPNVSNYSNKCYIVTPRMCKKYGPKWICFNRQYRYYGEVCGNNSVIYLRIPKVMEYSEMIVIPPNPELRDCIGNNCQTSDVINCSGCLTQQKETCSPYCYRNRCPPNTCTIIDQSEYCTKYRGGPGCIAADGCFQNYCHN